MEGATMAENDFLPPPLPPLTLYRELLNTHVFNTPASARALPPANQASIYQRLNAPYRAMRNAINTVGGPGLFAVVLRREGGADPTGRGGAHPFGPVLQRLAAAGYPSPPPEITPSYSRCKVYIPRIHDAMIVNPVTQKVITYGDKTSAPNADHIIIDDFPTVVGKDSNLGAPPPGSIIRVEFENLEAEEGGVMTGVVWTIPPSYGGQEITGANAFAACGGNCATAPATGDEIGSEADPEEAS